MRAFLLVLTLTGYLGTAILSVAQLYDMKRAKWAKGLAWLGFLAETVWLILQAGRGPVTLSQWVAFFVWMAVGLYLTLSQRLGLMPMGAFLLPTTFAIWALGMAVSNGARVDNAAHSGFWVPAHWFLSALADVCFLLTAVFAIMYIEKERELKSKEVELFYYRLPALDALDGWMARLLAAGWAIDTLALVTASLALHSILHSGPVWSVPPWGSLVMWVIYGLLLSARWVGRWRGHRLARGCMLAFLGVLIVVFGINLTSLGGRHLVPAL